MGLFSLKKKPRDEVRTLSEKEIQEKLYGRYRAEDAEKASEEAPPAAPEIPRPESPDLRPVQKPVQPQNQKLAVEELHEEPDSDLFSLPPSPGVSKDFRVQEKQTVKDAKKENIAAAYAPAEKKAFAGRPETLPSYAARPVKRFTSFTVKEKKPMLILKAVSSILGRIALILFGSLKFILQVFQKIDFHWLRTRQGFYWISGFMFLFILLGGIHVLNLKRESAMNTPQRRIQRSPENGSMLRATRPSAGVLAEVPNGQAQVSPLSRATAQSIETPAERDPKLAEGQFVIQIATYANEQDARRLLSQLNQAQWPSFIRSLERTGGKVYFSIFIGRFKTYREAQEALARFQKREIAQPFQDAFIRTLN